MCFGTPDIEYAIEDSGVHINDAASGVEVQVLRPDVAASDDIQVVVSGEVLITNIDSSVECFESTSGEIDVQIGRRKILRISDVDIVLDRTHQSGVDDRADTGLNAQVVDCLHYRSLSGDSLRKRIGDRTAGDRTERSGTGKAKMLIAPSYPAMPPGGSTVLMTAFCMLFIGWD